VGVADLDPTLAAVVADLPRARYVFFGFGDRHYLMASHHRAPTLLRAIWPGDGIMLVTGLEVEPEEGFGAANIVALAVSTEQLHALQGFIAGSFVASNGALTAYRVGPYPGSLYYLASPRYSALHTCNTWVAEVLQASGLNVRTDVIFASQLWSQVRRLQQHQAAGVPRPPAALSGPDVGDLPLYNPTQLTLSY
jgi:Protein of unknown function (DUF2459)